MDFMRQNVNKDVSSNAILRPFLDEWCEDEFAKQTLMTRISGWYEKDKTTLESITGNIERVADAEGYGKMTGLQLEELNLLFLKCALYEKESEVWPCYSELLHSKTRDIAWLLHDYLKFFRYDFHQPSSIIDKGVYLLKKLFPSLLSEVDLTLPEDQLADIISSILQNNNLWLQNAQYADCIAEADIEQPLSAVLILVWPALLRRIHNMIDKLIKTEASLPMKVFMFWWEFLLKSDITIENFHDSFKDGKPFIYLAQVCEFGPFGEHQYDLKLDLKLALAVLEAYGVPKMFDEDELNKLVEEKSPILFIYAAECVIALKGKFSVDNEQCPLCGIKNSLEIENALFKHMEQHHLKSQSQFSDERFDQSMLNTFRVRRHICPECKQTFPRESTLNGHLVANHNFRKCHVGICSFAFQSDDNLQEHLGCHPEKIACTVPGCKTACYGQEALDEHKGNCHVEIRSLSLQSDDNLQEHPECRPESEKISRTVPGCETLDENKGNCHVEIRPLSLQSDDNLQEHPECRPESEKISRTVPGCETLDDHKGNCHVGVRSLSLQSDDNLQEHPESEKIACTVPGCEALDHEHKGHEHGV